jgi:thioredoxin-like negative regulator of GroEL
MNPEILSRLLFALGLMGAGILIVGLINWLILNRASTRNLYTARLGQPVLLYFTTPTCAPCKTIQRPDIQRVSATIGEQLQIVEVDATKHPELASRWGVLTVPTTFLIDARGQARFVNHGVTRAEKLLQQIRAL